MFSVISSVPQIPGLWAPIAGTPDYHCVVDGQAYIARYVRTHGGFAGYKVHEAEMKRPTLRTALCIGGRPSAAEIRSYKKRYV